MLNQRLRLKTYSHQVKVKAEAEIFFEVWHFLFDLLRFRVRFRSLCTDPEGTPMLRNLLIFTFKPRNLLHTRKWGDLLHSHQFNLFLKKDKERKNKNAETWWKILKSANMAKHIVFPARNKQSSLWYKQRNCTSNTRQLCIYKYSAFYCCRKGLFTRNVFRPCPLLTPLRSVYM